MVTFPVSFSNAFYQCLNGMQMDSWGVANHSVGCFRKTISTCQFRMEENGRLSSGMNCSYLLIGI